MDTPVSRPPRNERWLPQRARVPSLLLFAALFTSSVAGAAAPTFQGTFTDPGLCSPRGVGISPTGDVFVGTGCAPARIFHFTDAGALVANWTFGSGSFGAANGVAVDGSGNVFGTDAALRKFSISGALITPFGFFTSPTDIVVNSSGEVFAAEPGNKRIQKYTNDGLPLTSFGVAGSATGQFQFPGGLGMDASGRIYVADSGRSRILELDLAYRIAISPTGAIFISEQMTHRITKFQMDRTTSASRTTFGQLKAIYR